MFKLSSLLIFFCSTTTYAVSTSLPQATGKAGLHCAAFTTNLVDIHSGGHKDCTSCKINHSDCALKCVSFKYVCKASGRDINNNWVGINSKEKLTEGEAKTEAIDLCYQEGISGCAHNINCWANPQHVGSTYKACN